MAKSITPSMLPALRQLRRDFDEQDTCGGMHGRIQKHVLPVTGALREPKSRGGVVESRRPLAQPDCAKTMLVQVAYSYPPLLSVRHRNWLIEWAT
jgi:hypothetical protein